MLFRSDVIGPSEVCKKKYDIILVDEAHRLHQYKNIGFMGAFKKSAQSIGLTTESDELDWILHQSNSAVLFYDENQVVGPSGIDVDRFTEKLHLDKGKRMLRYFELMTQMRVAGGNAYIDFVGELRSGHAKRKRVISNYDFRIVKDFEQFNHLLYEKENENSL